MAEKKRGKHRVLDEEKPTKEEYAVAKFLRFGLPVREGKLHGMEVKCFIASVAIDKLLESKWSANNDKTDPLFTNRNSCVNYMHRLLQKGLFHRAERDRRKRDKDKEKIKKKKKDKEPEEVKAPSDEGLRERKTKKDKKSKKEKETDNEEKTADDVEKKDGTDKKLEKKDEKKKKEKRLKLIMPDEQWFDDGDEVYVWIYDPVNAKTFLIGLLMVLGAIGLCMFPLWPEEVRVGVYYLSLAAAGFVGFILSLVVVRLVLFCCIWLLTLGKHRFWFLPNLTEDVGFFDSFKPLYFHESSSSSDKKSKESKKKKERREEEEKLAVEGPKKEKSSDKDDSDEFEVIKKEDVDENCSNNDEEEDGDGGDAENENGEDFDDEDDDEDDEDEVVDDESEDGEESNTDVQTKQGKKERKKKQ